MGALPGYGCTRRVGGFYVLKFAGKFSAVLIDIGIGGFGGIGFLVGAGNIAALFYFNWRGNSDFKKKRIIHMATVDLKSGPLKQDAGAFKLGSREKKVFDVFD